MVQIPHPPRCDVKPVVNQRHQQAFAAKETCHMPLLVPQFIDACCNVSCWVSLNTNMESMTMCLCVCKRLEAEDANLWLRRGIATQTCPKRRRLPGDPERPKACDSCHFRVREASRNDDSCKDWKRQFTSRMGGGRDRDRAREPVSSINVLLCIPRSRQEDAMLDTELEASACRSPEVRMLQSPKLKYNHTA